MAFLLLRWLFSEEYPLSNAKYTACTFVQLLMNVAQVKGYVEMVCGLNPGLTDSNMFFQEISQYPLQEEYN